MKKNVKNKFFKSILIFKKNFYYENENNAFLLLTLNKLSRMVLQTSKFGFNGPPNKLLQFAAASIKSIAH
jgi:hypothetical protein